ncbi:MAG: SIS domain-containing protein, partial [Desulfurococcales archaeon]|nr:SIS domain-containing protein [Desulfurococcales archaeon]
ASSVSNVVFCGMGGSGAAGLYVAHLLSEEAGIPSQVVPYYKPPAYVGRDTLVFAVSFSGNTMETLSCALRALERGARLVAVTRGGRLERAARDKGFPPVIVPPAPAPRAGFPGLLFAILGVLGGSGLLDLSSLGVNDALEMLSNAETAMAEAVRLAGWLARVASERRPLVVLSGYSTLPVGVRVKNEIAENMKYPSMVGAVPESGHNDIEAWSSTPNAGFLVLPVNDDVEKVMLDALLDAVGPETKYIVRGSENRSPIPFLLWPTWVSGIATVKAALELGVDPVGIARIGMYKKSWTSKVDLSG